MCGKCRISRENAVNPALRRRLCESKNMLFHNNPDLDTEMLNERLETVSSQRRRPEPLFSESRATLANEMRSNFRPRRNFRSSIANLPWIGPVILRVYRRMRSKPSWKERIGTIPVIGPLAIWVNGLMHLTAIRNQIALELAELRQMQHANHNGTTERLNQFANRLHQLDESGVQTGLRLSQLDELIRLTHAADKERDNRIAAFRQELGRLTSPAAGASAPSALNTAAQPISSGFDEESFYYEFEELFRGTRDEIKERLKVYLPMVAGFANDASARVVDVGTGRGEWLELLAENGINATGVDLNSDMVRACRERGYAAECMDAIAYLQQQAEGSLAAVTGFHIIEHLPFEVLIALFDAALRALRPDGLIIFETPNPENLTVGACNFYYDPTHRHPIVPAVAQFMARQRGFAHADILRLHPYPDTHRLPEDSEIARRINNALYGPQDFAVLAWKTHGN
jgi:2-polyprenyl-3-methyl-5-hydroxy-6-metoxy-1,4-benzoquinol methylase